MDLLNKIMLILLAMILMKFTYQDQGWVDATEDGVGEEDEEDDDTEILPPRPFVPPLDGLPPWTTDEEEEGDNGGGIVDGGVPPLGTSPPAQTGSNNATIVSNDTTTTPGSNLYEVGDGAGSIAMAYSLHWMMGIHACALVLMTSSYL